MRNAITIFAAAGALSLAGAAQQESQVVVHESAGVIRHSAAAGAAAVRILAMPTEAVKGAPYSAEAVNESVQILADGNRITHTSSSMQYRDSEGRTRSDNSLSPVGLWTPETMDLSISNLNDPVSGEQIMLDHKRKTALKSPLRRMAAGPAPGPDTGQVRVEVRRRMRADGAAGPPDAAAFTPALPAPDDVLVGPGPAVMLLRADGSGEAAAFTTRKEALGKRVIEGVECEGTLETITIEAGRIGNERPIQTVTERWYSASLRLDILRRTTDPRFGEMTYKLTRITQGEQPRSLFEVPSGYKLEDATIAAPVRRRLTRE